MRTPTIDGRWLDIQTTKALTIEQHAHSDDQRSMVGPSNHSPRVAIEQYSSIIRVCTLLDGVWFECPTYYLWSNHRPSMVRVCMLLAGECLVVCISNHWPSIVRVCMLLDGELLVVWKSNHQLLIIRVRMLLDGECLECPTIDRQLIDHWSANTWTIDRQVTFWATVVYFLLKWCFWLFIMYADKVICTGQTL